MLSKEMEVGSEEAPGRDSWDRRRLWLSLIAMTAATLVAFRTILIAPFGLVDPAEFEYWFFIPTRDSGALSVLAACWLLWNRRTLLASTLAARIGWINGLAALLVVLIFFFAVWMRVQAQLIPILCLMIGTLAAAWGGRPGLRLIAMPCAALLLAFPPPSPIQAEIIWRLQNLTAAGAHQVLTLAGYAVQLEGTELRFGGHAFVLIEACSGWRGIQVLFLVGLLAAELRGLRLRRALWVALAAIPLGIALNIVRACLVMLTNERLEAELFESHTPQGIAVLMVGSLVLYGIAMRLQGDDDAIDERGPEKRRESDAPPKRRFAIWAGISLGLPVTLALLSVVFPMIRDPLRPAPRYVFPFSTEFGPWHGTVLGIDFFFPYSTPTNQQFHMDYRDPDTKSGGELVDLFVARERPMPSGLDRMPNAKLLLPASDWTIVWRESARIWQLGVDAERAILSRDAGSKRTYVIAWRVHDDGLIRESLRSLLGLQGCDSDFNGCARVVVRIAVPILHNDEAGEARALNTANRFIDDFVLPLKILEKG